MQLTEHFSLEELTATEQRGLDNTPAGPIAQRLAATLAPNLETVRALLGGRPLHVNSGYRSPAVNAAVGGAHDSAHMLGYAADIICPAFGSPLAVCHALAGKIAFDQLIFENGDWCHISFDPRMRGQVMTKLPGKPYAPGLPALPASTPTTRGTPTMTDTTTTATPVASKPALTSTTIQGILVMLAATFAPQIAKALHTDTATLNTTIDNIGQLIELGGTVFGAIMGIVGRFTAKQPLH